jgi:ribosomal protein L37AE/L43A
MKELFVKECPDCNFCGKEASYDVPLANSGRWAFVCGECLKKGEFSTYLGTKFIKRTPSNRNYKKPIALGIEEATVEYFEEAMTNGCRTIACPSCNEPRTLEYDAHGKFKCDGCGQRVMIPTILNFF